jgi:hypothetical protein
VSTPRTLAAAVTLLSLCALAARADGFNPAALIGLTPREALAALGAPASVYPLRGPEENRDDVVFFYPDSTYLFWHESRVWQVRCDRRYSGLVLGLSLGMSRDAVAERLGGAITPRGNSLYYDLDGASFPTRVRLVFVTGSLSDVYVYRSDF